MFFSMEATRLVLLALGLAVVAPGVQMETTWWEPDAFDEVMEAMSAVTGENCAEKTKEELRLWPGTVSHLPRCGVKQTHENRTYLQNAHDFALNKAMLFSYLNAVLNETDGFFYNPGLLYHYISSSTAVTATGRAVEPLTGAFLQEKRLLEGSGFFYDTHYSYANWYYSLPFNETLPLFGARAWWDPKSESSVWVEDYGTRNPNYTHEDFQVNQWYQLFLPDEDASMDSINKHSYDLEVRYGDGEGDYESNETTHKTFLGPACHGDLVEPHRQSVLFTEPYFDCGATNQWLVTAAAPAVDYVPRYLPWLHLRRQRFTAVATADIEYQNIDFNACPLGIGNEPPNFLAGTARCKGTTDCQPLSGFGFSRGGYECHCKPGFHYPEGQDGPFQGTDIENATEEEYEEGFDCIPDIFRKRSGVSRKHNQHSVPFAHENSEKGNRARVLRKFRPRYHHSFKRQDQPLFDVTRLAAAQDAMAYKESMTSEKCTDGSRDSSARHRKPTRHRDTVSGRLPVSVAPLAAIQFESQALAAVRLSHFLSDYNKHVDGVTSGGEGMRPDAFLHVEHLFGELLANVMGELSIVSSGVYFDENAFEGATGTRRYFAPWVMRALDQSGGRFNSRVKAWDLSGESAAYIDEDWFQDLKELWEEAGTEPLQDHEQNFWIRTDIPGSGLEQYPRYPMNFKAPSVERGEWSEPYLRCDGKLDDWVITYAVPFFGPEDRDTSVRQVFKGAVTVSVLLDDLHINQCPGDDSHYNPFKNTASCNYQKAECVPTKNGFKLGSYVCKCKLCFDVCD